MRPVCLAVTLLAAAALGACVPRAAETRPARVASPPPRQVAIARPAPRPALPGQVARPLPGPTLPPLRNLGWADAPLSAGRWNYRGVAGAGSAAAFGVAGTPSFEVRCEPGRRVSLARRDAGGAASAALTFRASTGARTLPATGGAAQVPANDPLLDTLAFSRGRFAVETPGAPTLIVPAWPELARVVEDCRR